MTTGYLIAEPLWVSTEDALQREHINPSLSRYSETLTIGEPRFDRSSHSIA
jgi:hypothetical protein